MAVEYKALVLELLQQTQYPVLKDFVVMDIHYKLLPENAAIDKVHAFDRRMHDPLYVWKQHTHPFRFSYLSGNPHMIYVHETQSLPTQPLPFQCLRVKLSRGHLDSLQNQYSVTFEEELNHFIRLLNFDPAALTTLLGLDILTCTRLLPQFIKLWVYNHDTAPMRTTPLSKDLLACFGPPEQVGVIPVRVLNGQLAPCTSSTRILSLNDNIRSGLNFLQHYSDRWQAIFPLVYNPLENPLIVV